MIRLLAIDTHWNGARASDIGFESMIAIGIVVAIFVIVCLIIGVIKSGRE